MKNKDAEKYWDRFLQTGKVEDFLNYRKHSGYKETNTNIEIGKINDIGIKKEAKYAEKNSVYRNRSKKSWL